MMIEGVLCYRDFSPIARAVFFERLTWSVFTARLNSAFLAWKWPAMRPALSGFEPRRIAAWGPEEVAAYLASPAVVRNQRKILATIENAKRLLREERKYGPLDLFQRILHDLGVSAAGGHLQFIFTGLEEHSAINLARSLEIPESSLLLRD